MSDKKYKKLEKRKDYRIFFYIIKQTWYKGIYKKNEEKNI